MTDGKESACNVGDPGLIPGSGRPAWRREWQPTTVFLPGEFHGQRSLEGYSPWGHKESDTTEVTNIMNLPLYYECHTLLHLFITTICEVDTRSLLFPKMQNSRPREFQGRTGHEF